VKRMMLITGVGVVLGLLLILIPLFAISSTEAGNTFGPATEAFDFGKRLLQPGGVNPQNRQQAFSDGDLRILAFSFVVALVVYFLFKHKGSSREYRMIGPQPFRV